jgi:hypothetical protein
MTSASPNLNLVPSDISRRREPSELKHSDFFLNRFEDVVSGIARSEYELITRIFDTAGFFVHPETLAIASIHPQGHVDLIGKVAALKVKVADSL